MAKQSGTHVVTNKVRFMYTHLFEKYKNNMSGKEAYSTTILISKDDTETVDAIKAAMKVAAEEAKSRGITNIKRSPLRDGDEDRAEDPAYKNCWFINASSQYQPDVIDRFGNHINNPDDVYSGMYGRVSLNFFAYNTAGNKGISAGLGNVQKTDDGERLGGRSSAKADFADMIEEGGSVDNNGESELPF